MPAHIGKDLRTIKTENALSIAFFSLLERQRFEKIKVKDLCEEALVSRATFYAHFSDKYDLLKYCLKNLKLEDISKCDNYEKTAEKINQYLLSKEKIIRNLIYDADNETSGILSEFILSTLNSTIPTHKEGKINPQYIVISSFYAGGLIYYFSWMVKNKFPTDVAPMNIHLFEILKKFNEGGFNAE